MQAHRTPHADARKSPRAVWVTATGARELRLNLRLSRSEYELIARAAAHVGISAGTYAREALIAAAAELAA